MRARRQAPRRPVSEAIHSTAHREMDCFVAGAPRNDEETAYSIWRVAARLGRRQSNETADFHATFAASGSYCQASEIMKGIFS
jgi:hypothetical protein